MKNNNKTFLAAIGDCNSPKTWSGIPYFFLQEAKKSSLIDEGLNLNPDKIFFKISRLIWNFYRLLFFNEKGGYQYSNYFLKTLWKPHLKIINGGNLINCFQLYPKFILDRNTEKLYFFIDQTLTQLFEQYKVEKFIGNKIIKASLILEKNGYLKAKKIIVHSLWCKSSLINDYKIAEEKIYVIQPGANLFTEPYYSWKKSLQILNINNNFNIDLPLKLIFIGKEPYRKGLDRLLLGIYEAQKLGAFITIKIIGSDRKDINLPHNKMPINIDWLGFIDKTSKNIDYLSLISNCDIGCLLSRAEAGGICLREFHALGLAVMYSNVGGSPEHVIPNASIEIPLSMNEFEIGEKLFFLYKNKDEVLKLKKISMNNSETMLWSTTVHNIQKLLTN